MLLPASQLSRAATLLNPASLQSTENLPGLEPSEPWAVALVPDADGSARATLLAALSGRSAIVGPSRPWSSVRSSYLRALKARRLAVDAGVLDTDEHLVELCLAPTSTPRRIYVAARLPHLAIWDLKVAERLAETLHSWLLNQGRRDAVAAELFVHPQTVRYRMNQIRQAYGARIDEPATVLELTVALSVPQSLGC